MTPILTSALRHRAPSFHIFQRASQWFDHEVSIPSKLRHLALAFKCDRLSRVQLRSSGRCRFYFTPGFGNITGVKSLAPAALIRDFLIQLSGAVPVYIADYSHGSVYGTWWNATPESRLGHCTASFTDNFSLQLKSWHGALQMKPRPILNGLF